MPTRVVRWFRALTAPYRRSIQLKLILTMIVLSVLPVIAVTALAAEKSRASMETEVGGGNSHGTEEPRHESRAGVGTSH
ncbi:hypothetical protein E4V51_09955, partial [Paenibacillus sp. 28ISP30-2]|nr:hypothetical protein [Paenibacillus sp. 28ISP30-2]